MSTRAGSLKGSVTAHTVCLAIARMGGSFDTRELSLAGAVRRLGYVRPMMPDAEELTRDVTAAIEEVGSYVLYDKDVPTEALFVIVPVGKELP